MVERTKTLASDRTGFKSGVQHLLVCDFGQNKISVSFNFLIYKLEITSDKTGIK